MTKRTIAFSILSGASLLAMSLAAAGPAAADEPLNIVYTHHSSASNPFWQAVKKGFDDACAKIQANCQMIFTQTEGSVDQEVANQQAALARKPDALITTLVDNNAFVANLKDAKAKGVIVIASNVDATEGPELALRQAFVGQNFVPAGTTLGRRMAALFPKDGPIRVLVGVNAPGQNWSEQRAKGIMNGLEEYKKANPGREIAIDRLDVSAEGAVVSDRVGAYISAHPDT
ncbi:MAG TPA: substrate-binding domain-containing protein, partial [Roseiarcus sp.]|nr:substrate-binding domain-containing protein [Roseiarcus sp.]